MEQAEPQRQGGQELTTTRAPTQGSGAVRLALNAQLASAIGNRAFGTLVARSPTHADVAPSPAAQRSAAEDGDGELTLVDIIKANATVMEEYGFTRWMTDQQAAARLQELREQAMAANRADAAAEAAAESAHPSTSTKVTTWAAEQYQAVSEFLASTRLGKAYVAADESLAETSRNVGGAALDDAFGGLQQEKRKYGQNVEFATSPQKFGGELGELGYEALKSHGSAKIVGTLLPLGSKFKLKWNKAEADAAAWMWRTEGKVTWREAEIWIDQGGKLMKTSRRLDAIGFDIPAGTVEALEWTTEKQLAEGVAKRAQLEMQRELFESARKNGWRVLARPQNQDAFFDITDAVERTEAYPHFRKRTK